MEKKPIFVVIILYLTLLSGCGAKQPEGAAALGGGLNRPDFGQPERPADIRGLVSSMTGNEANILKIDRPQMDEEGGEGRMARGGGTEEERAARALTMGGDTAGRAPGGMAGGMVMGPGMGGGRERNFGGNGNTDADAQAQILARMREMASGEEKVLIPVGIRMLKRDPEASGREAAMIEATLEDIKANTMLQIWVNESIEDRNVAEFVVVTN